MVTSTGLCQENEGNCAENIDCDTGLICNSANFCRNLCHSEEEGCCGNGQAGGLCSREISNTNTLKLKLVQGDPSAGEPGLG